MTTRGHILSKAFELIGIADYVFDVTPEERVSALASYDALLAQWEGEGVDLGHTPADGDGNTADDITTPAWADRAIYSNLALDIAPTFGKAAGADVRRMAKVSYGLAVAKTLTLPRTVTPAPQRMGAGNRHRLG